MAVSNLITFDNKVKAKESGLPIVKTIRAVDVTEIKTKHNALAGNVLQKDQTETFTPTEDYEPATKKYVDNKIAEGSEIIIANVSGTYDIDWSKLGAVFILTMTANTVFSDIGFVEGKSNTIEIYLDGSFVPTFNTPDWEETPSSESYSGAVTNHIIASIKNSASGSESVLFANENLAT